MGKLVQRGPKSPAGRRAKRAAPTARVGASKKSTLRQLNRELAERHDEILRKAKENCRRRTGQETL